MRRCPHRRLLAYPCDHMTASKNVPRRPRSFKLAAATVATASAVAGTVSPALMLPVSAEEGAQNASDAAGAHENWEYSQIGGGDGPGTFGDGKPLDQFQSIGASDLVEGPDGTIYVVDRSEGRVRKVTAEGEVSTAIEVDDLVEDGISAQRITDASIDPEGRLIVASIVVHSGEQRGLGRVQRVEADGSISLLVDAIDDTNPQGVLASSGFQAIEVSPSGALHLVDFSGNVHRLEDDGSFVSTAASAREIAIAPDGTVYVANVQDVRIAYLDNDDVQVIAGSSNEFGSNDSDDPLAARFLFIAGLDVLPSGDLIVADSSSLALRRVAIDEQGVVGAVSTVDVEPDRANDVLAARGDVFVITSSRDINRLTLSETVEMVPYAFSEVKTVAGDGGPVANAQTAASDIAVREDGTIVLANRQFGYLREVAPNGTIDRVLGVPSIEAGSVATGPDGTTYVVDDATNAVHRIVDGELIRVFGGGEMEVADATSATDISASPRNIAVRQNGALLVLTQTYLIEVADDGSFEILAGNGLTSAVVEGVATEVALRFPNGVAEMPDGSLLVALDTERRVVRVTTDGQLEIFAGDGEDGGDLVSGQLAVETSLTSARDITTDPSGNAYVLGRSGEIQMITTDGRIHLAQDIDVTIDFSGPEANTSLAWDIKKDRLIVAIGTRLFEVSRDNLAPSITSPLDGAEFGRGDEVVVMFECSDENLASCTSSIAAGTPIDTSEPGEGSLTVMAFDINGNQSEKTFTWKVSAELGGELDNAGGAKGAVARLYLAVLDRVPDDAGLAFWEKRYLEGATLEEISAEISASPEFVQTYGDLNDREFVEQLYQNVLNRAGDAEGIEFWTGLLSTGSVSRAALITQFSEAPEFVALTGTESAVGGIEGEIVRIYKAFFEREPDAAGLEFWLAARADGLPLTDIAASFVNAPEFVATYGDLSDGEFINLVYRNVLGRTPDAGGFDFWLAQLTSGAVDRAGLMVEFSESVEFRRSTQTL